MHVCVCVSLVSLAITELEKATCVLAISVYAIGIVTSFTVFSAPKVLAYVLAASVSFYLSHCIHAACVFHHPLLLRVLRCSGGTHQRHKNHDRQLRHWRS